MQLAPLGVSTDPRYELVSTLEALSRDSDATQPIAFDTETFNPNKTSNAKEQQFFGAVRIVSAYQKHWDKPRVYDFRYSPDSKLDVVNWIKSMKRDIWQNAKYDYMTMQQWANTKLDFNKGTQDTLWYVRETFGRQKLRNSLDVLYRDILGVDPYSEKGEAFKKEMQTSDWSGVVTPDMYLYASFDVLHLIDLFVAISTSASELLTRLDTENPAEAASLRAIFRANKARDRAALLSTGEGLWVHDTPAIKYIDDAAQAQWDAVSALEAVGVIDPIKTVRSPLKTKNLIGRDKSDKFTLNEALLGDPDNLMYKPILDLRSALFKLKQVESWVKGDAEHKPNHYWGFLGADATTGRFTSKRYNVLNAERGSKYILGCKPDSNLTLLSMDYKGQELRTMTALMRDLVFYKALKEGRDLHQMTADAVGSNRQSAKNINFGLQYGMGARVLREMMIIAGNYCTPAEAEKYKDRFKMEHPDINTYHDMCTRAWKTGGYTRSLMGRYFNSDRRNAQINVGNQASGADALFSMYADLFDIQNLDLVHPALSVYDSAVWTVYDVANIELHATAIMYTIQRGWFNMLKIAKDLGISEWDDIPLPVTMGADPIWGIAQANADGDSPLVALPTGVEYLHNKEAMDNWLLAYTAKFGLRES